MMPCSPKYEAVLHLLDYLNTYMLLFVILYMTPIIVTLNIALHHDLTMR